MPHTFFVRQLNWSNKNPRVWKHWAQFQASAHASWRITARAFWPLFWRIRKASKTGDCSPPDWARLPTSQAAAGGMPDLREPRWAETDSPSAFNFTMPCCLMFSAALLMSLLIDHFGWLSNAVRPLDASHYIAMALRIGAIGLIYLSHQQRHHRLAGQPS